MGKYQKKYRESISISHPEIAAQWDFDKNFPLLPSDVSYGSNKKVHWKCDKEKDHEWAAAVCDRQKYGCPCCQGLKAVLSNCLATTHSDIVKNEWDFEKNHPLTPYDVVAGSGKKVYWKCDKEKDHEWEAIINAKISQHQNCPCCLGRKVVLSNCLATVCSHLIDSWHRTKNAGSNKKAWWQCSLVPDHQWESIIKNRSFRDDGCPFCSTSKGEKAILKYLIENNIVHKHQWGRKYPEVKGHSFDFAVERNGRFWLIEFHGIQHYLPKSFGSKETNAPIKTLFDVIKRDLWKIAYCERKNTPLLVIPFWDIDRINNILDVFFLGIEPKISDPPNQVVLGETVRNKIIERLSNQTSI